MRNISKHRIARLILALAILVSFGLVFLPFLTPILLATLFAFAADPTVSKLAKRTSKRKFPAAFLLTGIFLTITLPLVGLTYSLVKKVRMYTKAGLQNTELFHKAEELFEKASSYFNNLSERVNVDSGALSDMGEVLNKAANAIMGGTTAVVAGLPGLLLALFVFSAVLFVLLTQSKAIKKTFLEFDVFTPNELNRIITVVQKSSYTALVATAVSGTVQATLLAGAGYFAGFREILLIFIITFFSSFIPMIGTAPTSIILTVTCIVQGRYGAAVGMAVAGLAAGASDNIIKPLINAKGGGVEELNPVVALLAIIGAILIYGIPGVILGPVLTQMAFQILPILLKADEAESTGAGSSKS